LQSTSTPGQKLADNPLLQEQDLLRLVLLMQVLNNQYRQELRQLYDISEELED
jgi:hypothetical protein